VEGLGDGEFYGTNPAFGAEFSYFLAREGKEPGQLVIADSQGHAIRTLKGTHGLDEGEKPPEDEDIPPAAPTWPAAQGRTPRPEQQEVKPATPATPSQTGQQLGPAKGSEETESQAGKEEKIPWVPTKPGLQRLYWDLRADGPVRWESAKDFNKGPKSGALVPPGEYTATLTIDGQTTSQKIAVENDPRSHASPAALIELYQTTQSVLHEVSQLDVALNRIDAMQAQLKALRVVAKGAPDEPAVIKAIETFEKQIKAVEAQITSNAGAAESTLRMPDKIHEHLLALENLMEGADSPSTPAILEQKHLLEPEYQSAVQKFNEFLKTEAAAFNSAMPQHKLTGVVAGEPLQP
jgi:hypothetical protein